MRGRLRKTVVLTSRENFVWLSMQEIIPFIEGCWRSTALPGRHELRCLDVDRHSVAELMAELIDADNVVLTCFTVRLCRIAELLRKSLNGDARFFIYLHNQATIACWPLHWWGLGRHLREDDVFLSTSTSDARTLRHSFENARVEIVPFTLPDLRKAYRVPPPETSGRAPIPFVYVGRISVQKNLHTLIYAFRLFRDAHPELAWRLEIYGKDDNLGSPNMGMASTGYGKSLRALCRRLGLESQVEFKGYQKREALGRALDRRRHVAVSASLHSDENFGMAPFRSICHGNPAVLTRWGGLADFGSRFPDRVLLAPVGATPAGPWVDPAGFARLLGQAARKYRSSIGKGGRVAIPAYYLKSSITARLGKLALGNAKPGPALQTTALARRALARRRLFEKNAGGPSRIFESYSDPDSRILFRSYQMSEAGRPRAPGESRELRCVPWVTVGPRSIVARDPHRGILELPKPLRKPGASGAVLLTDWAGRRVRADRRTAARLALLGYAQPLAPGRDA